MSKEARQIAIQTLQAAIMSLVEERGVGKTICPSEAARLLSPDNWRNYMVEARVAASQLATLGRIVVTQRGRIVDAETAPGPIRLGLAQRPPEITDARQKIRLSALRQAASRKEHGQ